VDTGNRSERAIIDFAEGLQASHSQREPQRVVSTRKPSKLPPVRYGEQEGFSGQPPFSKDVNIAAVFERHYSVKELAELWNLSDRTIRRMFVGEPGVVEWGACESRMKRGYKTIRIPESIARRVHRRLRRAI
jgi:hypothetical protein